MRVSVYITCFNQQAFIAEALESVLNQTRLPDQIVVVDDASTDDSLAIIQGYRARYPHLIEVVAHEANQGVTQSRLDALSAVNGDYVTYLDGDDFFMPTKLEREVERASQAPAPVAVFSNYIYVDTQGQTLKAWASPDEMPPQGDVFADLFSWNLPSKDLFRSELVPVDIWRSEGFYDPCLNLYEDFEMRIRLSRRLSYLYCPEILSAYRRHGRGLSDSPSAVHLDALDYIFRKHRQTLGELPPLQRKETVRRFNRVRAAAAARAARQQSALPIRRRRVAAMRYAMKSWRYDPSRTTLRLIAETAAPEFMRVARRIKHRLR